MNKRNRFWILSILGLAAATAAIALAALFSGQADIRPGQFFAILRAGSGGTDFDILLKLRLPRIILAMAAGSGLALSGVLLQGMFRNPLVEPYTLGISGGAALGVCLGVVGRAARFLGAGALPLCGFAGAMLTLLFVYRAGLRKGELRSQWLLLTGVMVSFFCSSLIMLVMALAQRQDLYSILFWTMGSLQENDWRVILTTMTLSCASLAVSYIYYPHLNALALGDEEAMQLGIDTERTRRIFFIMASVLSGSCVAAAGIIGFVGLAVPHMVRVMLGTDARIMLAGSWLAGAGFLVLCDLLARAALSPVELPVGIITGIAGGGLFVYMLARKNGGS